MKVRRTTAGSRGSPSGMTRAVAALATALLLVASVGIPSAGAASPASRGTARSHARTAVFRAEVNAKAAAAYANEHPRATHAPRAKRTIPRPEARAASEIVVPPTRFETTSGATVAPSVGPAVAVSPGLVSQPEFTGIANVDQGCTDCEPPDPWIAVNSTYVVQSVNSLVRVSSRSGAEMATLPTWALFSLGPDEVDTDPRIIWDAYHARWVGVLLSSPGDSSFSENYLNIAVSTTSDPTGAWDIYALPYDEYLPDYPGIASSTDKIVLTANEYEDGTTFAGASIATVPWSSVLGGTSVDFEWWGWSDVWTIRPAQVLSTSADVHLVAVDAGTGAIIYARVTGSGSAEPLWSSIDNLAPIWDPTAPDFTAVQPRQPSDPPTITKAIDARITDAVWRNGQLWFVSTFPVSGDGGATWSLAARATCLAATTSATKVADWIVAAADADTFMPGIGISGDGTAFLVYSSSSPTAVVSTYATAWTPAYSWTESLLIEAGDGTYAGTRWGDYVGVAADPSGTAAVWQSDEVPTVDGSWRTVVSRLVFDLVPPTTPSTPSQSLVANTTLGSFTVPVKVTWGAASDTGSGIARYELQQSVGGSATGYPTSTGTATSTTRSHWWSTSTSDLYLRRYAYQVRAIDAYGNAGTASAPSSSLAAIVTQQTASVTYSGTWTTSSSSSYSGGSVKYSKTAGASATFSFRGRSVGFVSYRSSTRGKVKVYVDGTYKTTVTLTSSTTMARRIVYAYAWSTSGSHKLKLVVSSGRVDVDAFVVLK